MFSDKFCAKLRYFLVLGEKKGEKNGKKKGILIGKMQTAKKLLEKGISIDIISESTELPKEEILKLQNN